MGLVRARRKVLVLLGHEELPVDELQRRLRSLLDSVAAAAESAEIDGFSDCAELPPDVRQALDRIREFSPPRSSFLGRQAEPTFMAIRLDLREPDLRRAAIAFAPYSIHARFIASDGTELAGFDDTSSSVWFDTQFEPSLQASLSAPLAFRLA